MKKIFLTIFDLLFPRRKNDAAIADISPVYFYKKIPRWDDKDIYPSMKTIFHYKDPTTKAMIKELKSSKNRHAAQIAAHALANFFQENNIRDAIIVPMPISKKRRKKRGYNQCELIVEFLAKELFDRKITVIYKKKQDSRFKIHDSIMDTPRIPLESYILNLKSDQYIHGIKNSEMCFEIRTDILEKPVDTAKLALENRASRLKANEGVFRAICTLSHLKKRIIVIDDVITTGSTMHSAIDTLRAAGAKNVSGVGIAH